MAPIAKTMSRVREWIWDHPGRARTAVAAVVVTAVAGGALVGLRGGDADAGRRRHRQYSGSAENNAGVEGGQLEVPSESTAPAVADGSAPAGDGPGSPAGAGTTGPGAPTTAGGAKARAADPGAPDPATAGGPSTSTPAGSGQSALPKPSPGTTPTTRPDGDSRKGSPVTSTSDAPGWGLLPKAPIGPRGGHAAVWTGREMVIWGGASDFESDPSIDGAAFDPAARTWRKLPGAPLAPRFDARAYWTGQEVLVFGGTSVDGDALADGAVWDPAANTWRSIPASPLGPRNGAVTAWAGDRLVIWSGTAVPPPDAPEDFTADAKNDGAAYVPATNSWVPVGPAPIPPRSDAQSAWTGSRLIVTGGAGEEDDRTDGAALDPLSGAWSPIATRPTPGSCGGDIACAGFWTGTAVLFPTSDLAYDYAADRWSPLAPAPGANAPAPGEPAVWAGRQLLAWGVPGGAEDGSGADTARGDDSGDGPVGPAAAMYDPVTNRWQIFPSGPLRSRSFHTAVWTGETMLIWGGMEDGTGLADGAAYRPE